MQFQNNSVVLEFAEVISTLSTLLGLLVKGKDYRNAAILVLKTFDRNSVPPSHQVSARENKEILEKCFLIKFSLHGASLIHQLVHVEECVH